MAATMAMASEISMPYSAVSTALPMLVLDRSACLVGRHDLGDQFAPGIESGPQLGLDPGLNARLVDLPGSAQDVAARMRLYSCSAFSKLSNILMSSARDMVRR